MRKSHLIQTLIFFALLIELSPGLTVAPTVQPNQIYGSAGSYTFNTATYYNTATTTLNPLTFTLTFTNRTQTTTNYNFGYTIQEINYFITNNKINYSLVINGTKAATSIQAMFFTNNANQINIFKINYVIIEPLFGVYYFAYTWMFPAMNLSNTLSYNLTLAATATFNITGGTIWKTIVGVDAVLAANKQIDLYLSVTTPTSTSILFKISTISPTAFYLNSVVVGAYIYNYNELNGYNRVGRLTSGSFGTVNNVAGLKFTDSTQSVQTYNSILGTASYHIANQNYLHIQCNISPNNLISASTNYSFNYMEFNYMIMTFVYCNPASTPYLMVSNSTCYDVCPIRYYANGYNQCTACSNYQCYYCYSNGSCSQCSAAVDFRVLNTTTMVCDAMSGYYDNGASSQAIACTPTNCATCTSSTYCLSCTSAKYLTATNTCSNCMSNCLNCTSATNCQLCATFYYFTGSSCSINCTISNCVTCTVVSSALSCSTCVTGYYFSSGSCSTLCGDSIKVAATEGCDDGNTVSGDGCSSTCTIEAAYFCIETNSKSTCTKCATGCLNCTSGTSCQLCATFYYLSGGSCSINCTISNCNTCAVVSSALSCSTCLSGYYNSTCVTKCGDSIKIAAAQECDDGNTVSGDGCSATCTIEAAYYCVETNSKSTCSKCSTNCLNCTAINTCSKCNTSYYFSSSAGLCVAACTVNCVTVCGNGMRQVNQSCDDGNNANDDGCNSNCKIQTYYTCVQNSSGTSICSLSNLLMTTSSVNKDKMSNSVIACLKLNPSNNPSFYTTNWTSMVSEKTSFGVNITDSSYSLSSGLCISFNYFTSINRKDIAFRFKYPSTYPFSLLNETQTSIYLQSDNNLAINAYQSNDYSLANLLRVALKVLSYLTLILMAIGLIRQKLIPLQLTVIFQIAGFSLLTMQDLSPNFSAFDELSIICLGIRLKIFNETGTVPRRFVPLNYYNNFFNNFNIGVLFVLIPLLIGFIIKIHQSFSNNKKKICEKIAKNLIHEYALYFLLFSAYNIIISTFVAIQGWIQASLVERVMQSLSFLFVILIIAYLVSQINQKGSFGGYDEFFKTSSSFANYFYSMIIVEKIIVSLCLCLYYFSFQVIFLLVPQIIILCILLLKSPYSQKFGNFRQCFNYIIITIILVLLSIAIFFSDSAILTFYVPFAVAGCLLIAFLVTLYTYVVPFIQNKKAPEVYPIQEWSFQASKRKLGSSKDQSEIQTKKTKDTGFSFENKQKNFENYDAEDYIEEINANYVVQNPIMHVFRSEKSSNKRIPRTKKSAPMNDLLMIQESLVQMRNDAKKRRMDREKSGDRSIQELQVQDVQQQ